MSIPKIIHQVWEGRTEPFMPVRLQLLARTWQEQNPDWEYHLWNGKEMDELVSVYFRSIYRCTGASPTMYSVGIRFVI